MRTLTILCCFVLLTAAAARESDIELHLQCERQFLILAHAFDHHNYAKWETYQYLSFSAMKQSSERRFESLKTVGFTASKTGGVFNSVPGD